MRVSDTYKLKLLQSKYDELLAAFDDVHQRLTAFEVENEKLRAALKPFADVANHIVTGTSDETICPDVEFTAGDLRAAAAALKETGE